MPSRRRVLTGMRGEQPGGPQLVGITQLLRLSARQRHQPGFRLGGDNRIASCPRPIIQRLDYAQFRRSLQTACHRLLRHSNRARHCISRRVVQIGQDNPRPFDTARGLGSRPSNLQQTSPLFGISRQRDHSTRCYHWTPSPIPAPHTTYRQKEKSIRNILIFWNLYTSSIPDWARLSWKNRRRPSPARPWPLQLITTRGSEVGAAVPLEILPSPERLGHEARVRFWIGPAPRHWLGRHHRCFIPSVGS